MLRPLRLLIVLGALCATGSGRAETVKLRNGDILSGTLISQDESVIKLNHPGLGELSIPRALVASVTTSSGPPVEALVGLAPIPDAPASGTSGPTSSITPPSSEPSNPWKGRIELGYRQHAGRQEQLNFDFRTRAERQSGPHTLLAEARLLYGEQADQLSNERYDSSFRWRREVGDRFFTQTLTSYTRDNVRQIDQNWEQNLGAGFELFNDDTHVINIGAGFTGQYRETASTEPGFHGLVEVFEDYRFKINGRMTFIQNAVVQYSPDGRSQLISVPNQPIPTGGEANYKVRFDSTLQGKLTEQLSLNLRFEYEFDNAIVEREARADQRISSSVGYAF